MREAPVKRQRGRAGSSSSYEYDIFAAPPPTHPCTAQAEDGDEYDEGAAATAPNPELIASFTDAARPLVGAMAPGAPLPALELASQLRCKGVIAEHVLSQLEADGLVTSFKPQHQGQRLSLCPAPRSPLCAMLCAASLCLASPRNLPPSHPLCYLRDSSAARVSLVRCALPDIVSLHILTLALFRAPCRP